MSTQEIFDAVRALPPMERLRLASRILDDLTGSGGANLDIRDHWTDEDVSDLTAYAANHAPESTNQEAHHA